MATNRGGLSWSPALPAVLGLLVAANLLNNRLLPEAYLPVCLGSALLLLALARRDGCSWAELGLSSRLRARGLRWGAVAALIVLAGYLAAAALPGTRQALVDERAADLSLAGMLWHALVRVPLGTVLLEEVAFRGVLYALLARRVGPGPAVAVCSLLFGFWHVLPSLGPRHRNAAVADLLGAGPAGTAVWLGATVAGTTVAGVLFCELRRRSGSLLAPAGLHWALNSLGYGFGWAVSR